jgi:hypothetical protein
LETLWVDYFGCTFGFLRIPFADRSYQFSITKARGSVAPAYVRVSGTWANATYFADSDSAPSAPPAGFNGILTHQLWRGVVNFSQTVGAQIVTSFAISPGTRRQRLALCCRPDEPRRKGAILD